MLSLNKYKRDNTLTLHNLHNPYRLSKDIGVTQTRISEILQRKRSITADTALRLSRYFGNSAQFWLNLQTQYDLRQALEENAEVYNQIPQLPFNDVA